MQDLIVHILARGQRYETANYPNVAIPTNLDVKDGVRKDFGGFYAALFDRTLTRQPKAVVTEYSWDAGTCDPCPGPTLDGSDLMTLGMDALNDAEVAAPAPSPGGPPNALPMRRSKPNWRGGSGFVLTRMHLRYGKEGLGEDLVFRVAPPIVGGREFVKAGNSLETGAVQSSTNNFQARYAIRHAWTGPVKCASPQRGIWGGPPGGVPTKGIEAAQNLAFAKRGGFDLVALVALVAKDDNETKIDSAPLVPAPAMYAAAPDTTPTPAPTNSVAMPSDKNASGPPPTPPQSGCAGCRVGDGNGQSSLLLAPLAIAIASMIARLRRK
jgi:hypothetical protein